MRASIRRENQQRRTRERAHARHGLSASFLDDDDSIAAIKNKYKVHSYAAAIDIEVSRLAIVCPCLFRIMILCYSPRPKSG